jgi:adenylyltransferase/sulfurtransferase
MLTEQEYERYQRQLLLSEIQEEGQERLKSARVAIIGVGGLGSPAATYLAYAGIGNLRLIDRDRVEASNLNRQTLHTPSDIGRPKVESAKDKLAIANPAVVIEALQEEFNAQTADRLLCDIDVALDCLDNLTSRILLNEACFRARIPFVHAAVHGFDGEVGLFVPGKTACYSCYLGKRRPPAASSPFPVIGTTPGLLGVIQSLEALKWLLGLPSSTAGSIHFIQTLSLECTRIRVAKLTGCIVCQG